jgi:hypothetical protein
MPIRRVKMGLGSSLVRQTFARRYSSVEFATPLFGSVCCERDGSRYRLLYGLGNPYVLNRGHTLTISSIIYFHAVTKILYEDVYRDLLLCLSK